MVVDAIVLLLLLGRLLLSSSVLILRLLATIQIVACDEVVRCLHANVLYSWCCAVVVCCGKEAVVGEGALRSTVVRAFRERGAIYCFPFLSFPFVS